MQLDGRANWIGFDLDGTLHDFSGAATAAVEAVVEEVERFCRGVEHSELITVHRRLAKQDAEAAFTEGWRSEVYRKRRFERIVKETKVQAAEGLIDQLLEVYEREMMKHLELVDGAQEVVDWLCNQRYSIAVITEGPEDAQVRAIRRLGLEETIKVLVTSGRYRVSKPEGLFSIARGLIGVEEGDSVLFFGDSLQRDMLPARKAGYSPVFVDYGQSRNSRMRAKKLGFEVISELSEAIGIVRRNEG